MLRNEFDSEATGFTETTTACQPFPKQKPTHKQFLFFYVLKALGCTGYLLGRNVNLTGAYICRWACNSQACGGIFLARKDFGRMFDIVHTNSPL